MAESSWDRDCKVANYRLVLKILRLLSESKFQTTNVRLELANAWHNLLDDKVTVFPKAKRNGFVQV